MKNKIEKRTILTLLIAFFTVLLVACGGEEKEVDVAEAPVVEEAGGGKLEVAVDSRSIEFIKDIIPEFEEQTGVSVEVTERAELDLLEALSLDGPAGLAPDVMIAPYDQIGILSR